MSEMAGRDWAGMRPADFDTEFGTGEPLALVDADVVTRPVLAVTHANGTDALFGGAPISRRATRTRGPAATPTTQGDTLF
ncbi:hypothetical protein [Streptomyces sp. NBC_00620]|uniref:hypothetical protein n=1 Tax=Streptomyces sp. NBC_00620 TaxID=2903666 RepID=UPI002250D2EB|nr:hypothetical protein [Streptomyces sp. NBC_00620]MCX4976507.1 hypothetical protein [Streptomyces sp. NBC_00620]